MPSEALPQGPLDHLGIAARAGTRRDDSGIRLVARGHRQVIELRGKPTVEFLDALVRVTGIALPASSPHTSSSTDALSLWMGPDRWWMVADRLPWSAAELRRLLAAVGAGVTEIGDSLAVLALDGPQTRDVLAKGCTLDLHPRTFLPGHVAQTLLAKTQITLNQVAASEYEIYVRRSFAEYLWTWLEDAASEYGVSIEAF